MGQPDRVAWLYTEILFSGDPNKRQPQGVHYILQNVGNFIIELGM